ncbi:MAG: clostripain-related cysteine peptidase [Armatimonadota bacterium]
MRRFLLVFVALWASVVAWGQTKAEWTMLAYMDADNDLEYPLMLDLIEMMEAGSSRDFRIIALVDRIELNPLMGVDHDSKLGGLDNWTGAKLVEVEKGKLKELADWGELDMGDPATLNRFIDEGLKIAPAKRVNLQMSDHGGGWMPGWVDMTEETHLTLDEIQTSLETASKKHGKFELLTFDACLMATVEVAAALSDSVKYMIASEELVPGLGFYYGSTLAALRENPRMSTEMFAKQFIQGSYDFYAKSDDEDLQGIGTTFTCGLLKLDRARALHLATSHLGIGLQASFDLNVNARQTILRAQRDAFTFGEDFSEYAPALVDLADIPDRMGQNAPVVTYGLGANDVRNLMKQIVLFAVKGDAIERADGISVFWPRYDTYLQGLEDYDYRTLRVNAGEVKWPQFITRFIEELAKDTKPPTIKEEGKGKKRNLAAQAMPKVTWSYDPKDTAEIWSFLGVPTDNEDVLLIGMLPAPLDGSGKLELTWTGTWPALFDSEGSQLAPILGAEYGEKGMTAYLRGQLELAGGQKSEAVLTFFGDYKQEPMELVRIALVEGSQLRTIVPEPTMIFRPEYPVINFETGATSTYINEESEPFRFGEKGLWLQQVVLPAQPYRWGVYIEDFAGNSAGAYRELTFPAGSALQQDNRLRAVR